MRIKCSFFWKNPDSSLNLTFLIPVLRSLFLMASSRAVFEFDFSFDPAHWSSEAKKLMQICRSTFGKRLFTVNTHFYHSISPKVVGAFLHFQMKEKIPRSGSDSLLCIILMGGLRIKRDRTHRSDGRGTWEISKTNTKKFQSLQQVIIWLPSLSWLLSRSTWKVRVSIFTFWNGQFVVRRLSTTMQLLYNLGQLV